MSFIRKILFGEAQPANRIASQERAGRDAETRELLEKRFAEEVVFRKKAELLVSQHEAKTTEYRSALTELRSELAKALAREDWAKRTIRDLRASGAEPSAVKQRLQTLEHDLAQSNRRHARVEEKLQQEKTFRIAAEQQVMDLQRSATEVEQVSRDLRLALAREKRAKKLSEERRLELQQLYESNANLRKDLARLRRDSKKRDLQLQQALAQLETERGLSGRTTPDDPGEPFDGPPTQERITRRAAADQETISRHTVADDAVDWGDVSLDLPQALIEPSSNPGGPRRSSPESTVRAYADKGLGRYGREKVDLQPDDSDGGSMAGDPVDWLDHADDGVDLIEPPPSPARSAKTSAEHRRTHAKALRDAWAGTGSSEGELATKRSQLKSLIRLGKSRGFLTYAEITDHLPENIGDAETIDSIISIFREMGITVYERACDAEPPLFHDTALAALSEDDEEAEAVLAPMVLATVDSEFSPSSDPVRMYMREMGSVELLTREGEIEIAKRIEDGLKRTDLS